MRGGNVNPEPHYNQANAEVRRRGWWHLIEKYEWFVDFTSCPLNHTAAGVSRTEEGCQYEIKLADTRHAMHHARVEVQESHARRIRAD